MSPWGGKDALRSIDEIPALEHEEGLEDSKDLILRYTGERLCNFGSGMTVSNLVQLPFRIHVASLSQLKTVMTALSFLWARSRSQCP